MMMTEKQLLRVINDSYEDGTDCETLSAAYNTLVGDGLATFIVRECAESSETRDGLYDPEAAAIAMQNAADQVQGVADAMERMSTAEVTDDGLYG
ncbi:MAG: hypothetical protein KAJ19_22850 [Gammaproteobacteria bacterium]|nr:hypothetical protein [Gammaproteobacteria bacterium]